MKSRLRLIVIMGVLVVLANSLFVGYLIKKHNTRSPSVATRGQSTPVNTQEVAADRGRGLSEDGLTLDLHQNELKQIPADVFEKTSVTTLNLSYNQIGTLPASISKLQNLQTLNIAGCGLFDLPAEIGDLPNLKELIVDTNNITTLPESILRLRKLEKLDISYNNIQKFPDFLSGFDGVLKDFNIDGNPIDNNEILRVRQLMPSVNVIGTEH